MLIHGLISDCPPTNQGNILSHGLISEYTVPLSTRETWTDKLLPFPSFNNVNIIIYGLISDYTVNYSTRETC